MRNISVLLAFWLAWGNAMAAGPEYKLDPFGDSDFGGTPLILDVAYPSRGRAEVSFLFASSLIDKYSTHMGGLLQFDYNVLDSIGVGMTAGYLHGSLTNIVTDGAGILGNKVQKCQTDPTACGNINPNVPDYKQITGLVSFFGVWSPLYGKINIVSELDANMQLYFLAGGGVNGTRNVLATEDGSTDKKTTGYALSGHRPGAGGFLNGAKPHGTLGVGLQVFFFDFVALRADVRGILFRDEFDFQDDKSPDGYTSQFWFVQVGLGFALF